MKLPRQGFLIEWSVPHIYWSRKRADSEARAWGTEVQVVRVVPVGKRKAKKARIK